MVVQSRTAGLFGTAREGIITAAPIAGASCAAGRTPNQALYYTEPGTPRINLIQPMFNNRLNVQLVAYDFLGLGADQVLVIDNRTATLFGAVDPGDSAKGLRQISQLALCSGCAPANQPAAGDFNADGIPDVAWVTNSAAGQFVVFVFVCPASARPQPSLCKFANQIVLSSQVINLRAAGYFTRPATIAADEFKGIAGSWQLAV